MARPRPAGVAAVLAALALLATACADDPLTETPVADDDAVVVGSANFPESVMLGHAYALALEDAGVAVDTELNIGAREIYFEAMERGEIDVLPEYLGSLLNHLSDADLAERPAEELLDMLRAELDERGIAALEPSEAENRNALVVTRDTAEAHDLASTSDLAPIADELVAGGAPEATERDDRLPGLERVYGIEFADFRELDPGGPLTIEALEQGEIDVAFLFTSQGVIAENQWVALDDDRALIPAENLLPVVREDALTDDVAETLNALSDALTLDELVEMNVRVEVDNEDPDRVAEQWLRDEGLIDAP